MTAYGVNKETQSTDNYLALPVDVLGTEYIALTFVKDSEIMIVATQNDTQVNLTLPNHADNPEIEYDGQIYRYTCI